MYEIHGLVPLAFETFLQGGGTRRARVKASAFECCNPVFEWLFYLPIAAVEDVVMDMDMDMGEMLPGVVSAAFA